MATDFDAYLAPVLDVPAEVARVVFPRHAGSALWGIKRRLGPRSLERSLKATNLLTVTADRVLLFPQHLAYGSGLTLRPAILDWPRARLQATGERRCHTFTGDIDRMEGEGPDYVLLTLAHEAERVQVELHRKGHTLLTRTLGIKLTGRW